RHVAGDGQAETDPPGRRVPRRIEANKGSKCAIPVRGTNPRSIIVDQDVDAIGDRDASEPDVVAMAAGVADQIAKAPSQSVWSHRHQVFGRDGKRQRRSLAPNSSG